MKECGLISCEHNSHNVDFEIPHCDPHCLSKEGCKDDTLSPKQRLINEHYLLKEELSHTIDMQGSLTDPRVVAASEELNKVAVQLQRMGEVANA